MQSLLDKVDRWWEESQKIQELDLARQHTLMEFVHIYSCYFLCYSLLGWVWETVITSIDEGGIQERGFLHLPICPIYGVAIVLIIFLFYGKPYHRIVIFIGGAVVSSVIEYVTSWGFEQIFHQLWWDYSQMRFQIDGRISLFSASIFGIASIVIIQWMHPMLERKIEEYIHSASSVKISCTVAIVVLIDTVYTCAIRLI